MSSRMQGSQSRRPPAVSRRGGFRDSTPVQKHRAASEVPPSTGDHFRPSWRYGVKTNLRRCGRWSRWGSAPADMLRTCTPFAALTQSVGHLQIPQKSEEWAGHGLGFAAWRPQHVDGPELCPGQSRGRVERAEGVISLQAPASSKFRLPLIYQYAQPLVSATGLRSREELRCLACTKAGWND